jgi:hypothetical protein
MPPSIASYAAPLKSIVFSKNVFGASFQEQRNSIRDHGWISADIEMSMMKVKISLLQYVGHPAMFLFVCGGFSTDTNRHADLVGRWMVHDLIGKHGVLLKSAAEKQSYRRRSLLIQKRFDHRYEWRDTGPRGNKAMWTPFVGDLKISNRQPHKRCRPWRKTTHELTPDPLEPRINKKANLILA